STWPSEADRLADDRERRLHHGLGERRMRVDRAPEVLDRPLERHRERDLGDELRRLGAADMPAQDLAVARLAHDLDDPFGLAAGDGAPERPERRDPDPHVVAGLARLLLRQADGRDLGVAVHAGRDAAVVDPSGIAAARRNLDRGDALGGGDVRERRRVDRVADREHVRDGRLVALVHRDVAALERDSRVLDTEPRGARRAPDGDEASLGLDRDRLPLLLGLDPDAAFPDGHAAERAPGADGDLTATERARELARDLRLDAG